MSLAISVHKANIHNIHHVHVGACRMSEDDEVIEESKKVYLFPTRRGTSYGVNIPPKNLKAFAGDKPIRQFLVKIFTMRGKDGKKYLVIRRVKIE